MSDDSFTEVTNQSYFQRIGGAFKGIVIGIILILVSCFLLFWNEGRAVKRYKTLVEGSKTVISVASDIVDAGHEQQLVHLTGMATSDETLTDQELGVSAASVIKLKRTSTLFQWQEKSSTRTEKQLGGGEQQTTTYTYSKVWAEQLIDSSSFKKTEGHQNPANMPFQSRQLTSLQVSVGSFFLSPSLISNITNYESLTVDGSLALPSAWEGRSRVMNDGFYLGADPANPQVGDIRISYQVVKPLEVSVIARQAGNHLQSYQAKAGDTIELLELGVHDAQTMFEQEQQSNTILTWLLRAGGFFLMFIGISLIVKPLSVLADVIPVLGSLVAAGTGVITFLLAGILSSLIIAVAWFVFRPLIAILALSMAGVLIFLVVNKMKKGKSIQGASGSL
ncbi:TMEM43 family protein [Desulforhopalus vacuolatus]|uniref:TMEM43 family protein n=1 Tax=Desulforhopalus vacuolatus TaxID=40414 RepID=UPI001965A155|nr:TMEM43 family protein [Desulforhopalus vacuolatus]MBM9518918.1 TMEM43 family protein [Desulforhopalus vacuolatus]